MRAAQTRAASRTYPLIVDVCGDSSSRPVTGPRGRRGPRRAGEGCTYFRYPAPRELWAAGLYTQQVRNGQRLLGDGLDVPGEKGRVRRLRRGTVQQHAASLPVDRSGASRQCRLAARVSEGGNLRRDPVLKCGPGGLRLSALALERACARVKCYAARRTG